MTCLILPAWRPIAWSGLAWLTYLAVRRLYSKTRSVCLFSSSFEGTATLMTLPSIRFCALTCLLRSALPGGLGLRVVVPLALETSRRVPSGEQTTADGYQPAAT